MRLSILWVLLMMIGLTALPAGERFACNMNALGSSERARHRELSQALFAAVQERKELPNGYGFRMAPEHLVRAAEWVSLERKCCPFFAFEIEQGKNQGPLWLRITGADGVKPFIREEFGL